MTQSIIISVGQCGNQIGSRFWDLALREHAEVNSNGVFDSAFNSFFRNVDPRSQQVIFHSIQNCVINYLVSLVFY